MTGMMSSSFAFTHAIKTSNYWDTRAPIRSLSDSAKSEEVGDAAEKKPKYKGKTIFDVIGYLDNFGVGWRLSRNPWIRKYPDSYWIITRVKLFPNRRAWGKKVWKGQLLFDGAERRVKSASKREWRYLCKDTTPAAAATGEQAPAASAPATAAAPKASPEVSKAAVAAARRAAMARGPHWIRRPRICAPARVFSIWLGRLSKGSDPEPHRPGAPPPPRRAA
eukprot:CAMPEP_0172187542 /NCGR_PEP_ID=MMETSP1050-20130122/21404_1 /TAXON_ID=233186 /ORGANISM="Cryptomonas curvata, Strain CCAP979/52" /LENGTH=220 /DNA_ID=CAMNT_0012861893 /DNA_START=199 /DNA_END=857 /DNA_ORIENTATION=+